MDVWSIGHHWQNFFDLGFSANYFGPSGDPVLIVLLGINSRSSRHICHWLSLWEFGSAHALPQLPHPWYRPGPTPARVLGPHNTATFLRKRRDIPVRQSASLPIFNPLIWTAKYLGLIKWACAFHRHFKNFGKVNLGPPLGLNFLILLGGRGATLTPDLWFLGSN